MKLLKAAVGAALACILCAGMTVTAMADTQTIEVIGADGQVLEIKDADPDNDPEYIKYRNNIITEALGGKTPAGQLLSMCKELEATYGADLNHDSRFDGLGRTYCIDVSQWQSSIDWNRVKAAGIDSAIIRVGYRGYGSAGTLCLDPTFHTNIQGALNAGLDVGVYFFTQAINEAEARAEADYCTAAVSGYDLKLPVYIDIEDQPGGRVERANLNYYQRTAICRAFCERMAANGYETGVYSGRWWFENMLDGPGLGMDYRIWLACFMNTANYGGIYDIWQFTGSGHVDGISSIVDISVVYDVDFSPQTKINLTIKNNRLSWNAAAGADGYTIYDEHGRALTDTKATNYDPDKLRGNSFTVAAYNYYGGKRYYGKRSNSIELFVGEVEELFVERSGYNKVYLIWTEADNASGYEVYLCRNGVETLLGTTEKAFFEIEGEDLQDCTVKVRPYSAGGLSGEYSDEITLLGNAPAEAPVLEVTGPRLIWSKVKETDGYIVTLTDSNGNVTEFVTRDIYLDIDNSKTGTYFVEAYIELDGIKCRSEKSNSCVFKGVNYPPQGVIDLDFDDSGLFWNKIDDALGYVIYELGDDGEEHEIARVNKCSYSLDDLTGAVYFVKGYNTKDDKEYFTEASNCVTITLPAVTEVRLNGRTNDLAFISWDGVEGCSEYTVFLDTGDGYRPCAIVSGTMAVVNIGGAEHASVMVKGYVGGEDVVNYSLFSNELRIF